MSETWLHLIFFAGGAGLLAAVSFILCIGGCFLYEALATTDDGYDDRDWHDDPSTDWPGRE